MKLPSFRNSEPKFDTDGFYKSDAEMKYLKEKDVELKNILEKVDVNVLVDIFMETYKKAVPYNERDEYELLVKFRDRLKTSFLKSVNIKYSGRMGAESGSFDRGAIQINSKEFGNISELEILKIVLHEFVHGFSGQGGVGVMYKDGGLDSSYLGDNKLFVSLNEAVTEIIADYILTEYIKRSGNKGLYERFDILFERSKVYYFEQIATRGIIKTLSKEVGVPEDLVMESLFGHYIRGDFKKALEELTESERSMLDPVKGKSVSLSDSLIFLLKKVFSE